MLVAAGISALAFGLREDQPDHTALAQCDTELRAQLTVPELTPSVANANATIIAIQQQRTDSCRAKYWNPLVTNADSDHLGNIDIKLHTGPGNADGTAVTTPADGRQRWVYLAEENQWYAANIGDPSVLATRPTVTPQQQPNPGVTPQLQSLPTRSKTAASQLMPTAAMPTAIARQARPTPTLDPRVGGEIKDGKEDYFIGAESIVLDNAQDLFYQGKYREAIEQFEQIQQTRLAGPSAIVHHWIARSYAATGNHQKAVEHYSAAIGMEDNGTDRVGRAASYLETGQWTLAAADAEAALAMKPETSDIIHSHAEAHVILAAWYATEGNLDKVDDHVSRALSIMQTMEYDAFTKAITLRLEGAAATKMGNLEQAIKSYSEAISYIDDAQVRTQRASVYLEQGQCSEATADAAIALSMEPIQEVGFHSDAAANTVMGTCNVVDGDLIGAERHFAEALDIMNQTQYTDEDVQYWTEFLNEIRNQISQ